MIRHTHEDALSEVIGFILIIAVLTIIASLYLVYVVPAQGREAEIAHMNYVQDQFVDFKIRMDSLWLNNEPNVTVSQNIEMGTLGSKTEGNLAIIPILQPVGSDGEIVVEAEKLPIINITTMAYSIEEIETSSSGSGGSEGSSPYYSILSGYPQYAGSGIYPTNFITINPGPIPTPLPTPYPSWILTPVNLSEPGDSPPWVVYLNVTNTTHLYPDYQKRLSDPTYEFYQDYVYDIEMWLKKFDHGKPRDVFQNMTIFRDIKNENYVIDLYDPAYGLGQNYAYTNLTAVEIGSGSVEYVPPEPEFNIINTSIVQQYEPTRTYNELQTRHSMGTFSYTGNNFYWIPQTYFYQMGGVFLAQDDGMTNKIAPLINLYVVPGKNSPGVRISDLYITRINSTIAGTSPVQVLSTVEGISSNCLALKSDSEKTYVIADTNENVNYVKVKIETNDQVMKDLWHNTFQQIKYSAIVSGDTTSSPFNPHWVYIEEDKLDPDYPTMEVLGDDRYTNDVTFEYTKVETSIVLQPVGFSNV